MDGWMDGLFKRIKGISRRYIDRQTNEQRKERMGEQTHREAETIPS